jgi:hypothetical protein
MTGESVSTHMRSRCKSLAVKLGLVLVSVAVGLTLSEGILRILVCMRAESLKPFFSLTVTDQVIEELHPLRNHSLIPGISFTSTGRPPGFEYCIYGKISSQGLNSQEIPLHKAADEKRILVLGDSFVEARQVPREKNFCSVLQEFIAGDSLGIVRVINAGVSTYSPLLEYLYFTQELKKFEPDVVVLVLFANDVFDDMRYSQFAKFNDDGIPVTVGPGVPWLILLRNGSPEEGRHSTEYKKMVFAGPSKTWATKRFYLATILEYFVFTHRVNERFPVPPQNEELFVLIKDPSLRSLQERGWALTKGYVALLKRECDEIDAKMFIACSPIASQIQGHSSYDHFFFTGQPTELDQINTERMAEDLKIGYVDLATPLKKAGEGLYFPRDGHWTPKGHSIVAQALSERIQLD